MKNPFIFGGPVMPQDFYGRRDTVQFFLDRLYGRSRSSIALWGDRRVGKSSLLYFLMQPDLLANYVDNVTQHHVIFIDCQMFTTSFSRHAFWQEVLEQLSERVVADVLVDHIERLLGAATLLDRDIRSLLRRMQQAGETVTLLLDEFSHIIWSGQLNDAAEVRAFLAFMRTVLTAVWPTTASPFPRPLALVTSTRRPLNEVCRPIYPSGDIGSPFHNPFVFERLQPFTEADVHALLDTKLSPAAVVFAPAERAHLLAQTGRHPILVQSYASELFRAKQTDAREISDFRPIDNEFYDRSQHHFYDFWQYSSPAEQYLMSIIVDGRQDDTITPEQENARRQLVERGLLQQRNRFFSPLFHQWLRLNHARLAAERATTPLPDTAVLLQIIDQHFNESDLRNLMFELDLEYGDLAGETKRGKVRELIYWAQRHAYLTKLVNLVRRERPFLKI